MFSLLFLLSVSNCKSAVDTLPSVALFLSRDLKFRLRGQALFHLVECVMTFQRNDLMFFSVEKRGGILKGEPCGTADGTAVPSKFSNFISVS